jgi:uncharacterized protein (TIGR03067 family)
MKFRAVLLFAVCVPVLASCRSGEEKTGARELRGQAREDAARPLDARGEEELRRLEGTWLLESAVDQGQPVPAARLVGSQMQIAGGTVLTTVPARDSKPSLVTGKLRVDVSAEPKRWDERERSAAGLRFNPDAKREGIYELNGDALRVAFPVSGGTPAVRPKSFAAGPDSGVIVLTYRRRR